MNTVNDLDVPSKDLDSRITVGFMMRELFIAKTLEQKEEIRINTLKKLSDQRDAIDVAFNEFLVGLKASDNVIYKLQQHGLALELNKISLEFVNKLDLTESESENTFCASSDNDSRIIN